VVPGFGIIQADGTALPIVTASIDVITSFETLEHIPDYPVFLSELRRVLKPNGLLLLSTPNALITKPVNGIPFNPYHIREFTPEELRTALAAHFNEVELFGQCVAENFRPCPYWETKEVLPKTWGGRVQVGIWKTLSRFPLKLRDSLSRSVLGHDFYPGENDFVFAPDFAETGHVLLAVCSP
jgi:SAM-dependent methyltransferase